MKIMPRISWTTLLSAGSILLIGMNPSFGMTPSQGCDPKNQTQANANSLCYTHCSLDPKKPCNTGADENKKFIADQHRASSAIRTYSASAGRDVARVAIDINNTCRWVDRSTHNKKLQEILVPFRTDTEWTAFLKNAPSEFVTLADCARPSVNIPPNDPAGKDGDMPCYDASGKLQTKSLYYTDFAYGRENDTLPLYPQKVNFSCYRSDGTGSFPKSVSSITIHSIYVNGLSADRTDGNGKLIGSSGALINTNVAPINPNDKCKNPDWDVLSATYTTPTAVCGTADGANLSDAPSGASLCKYGEPSVPGGTGPWTWTCKGLKNTASCTAYKPINGSCGSAHGKSLTSAPSAAELCSTGTGTTPSGLGPWSWTCEGKYGGTDAPCSASKTPPTCPPVSVYGPCNPIIGCIAQPLNNGYLDIKVSGVNHGRAESNGKKSWDSLNSKYVYYTFGSCFWGNYLNHKDEWVNCIVTEYVKTKVAGYSDMTGKCVVKIDEYLSPLKVNLGGGDAAINSTQPTLFYLTLNDGRIMEGHATGGLNSGEGWLMVRRTKGPHVYGNGALNGDHWFGDRDGRSLNGFTDLAETFSRFIETDEHGQRFIPLNILTQEERNMKAARAAKNVGQITDPSFDLRVVDASNKEHLASDYFSRIYVDYRNIVEGDGTDGKLKDSKNVVLERGTVRTVNGVNRVILDQWFVIDLPADMRPTTGPTKSRILPARK